MFFNACIILVTCKCKVTHCISFMVPQGQWGVKPREDSQALECMAALWLQSSPRAPAPSPIVLQRQQLLHTAVIAPLTIANTTRPIHRYCNPLHKEMKIYGDGCECYWV